MNHVGDAIVLVNHTISITKSKVLWPISAKAIVIPTSYNGYANISNYFVTTTIPHIVLPIISIGYSIPKIWWVTKVDIISLLKTIHIPQNCFVK